MSGPARRKRVWTIPNGICALRMAGTLPLLWAAHQGHRQWVLWIMVVLLASDWLDGKLATLLDQKTEIGALFDSVADAVMYAALALSFWWLEGEVIRREIAWFLGVGATWLGSAVVALIRLGRMPSYHSWGAKASWFVAGVVAILWLLTGRAGAVPWALGLVILTNLEAAVIGLVLPEWRADVATLWHALRIRRSEREEVGSP